ncbi:MAG: right-handed parallel beta-helix repeat-containing protein, partial [Bacteroidota bacterium]
MIKFTLRGLLVLLATVICMSNAFATPMAVRPVKTFYVATTGNDAVDTNAAQNSATPWKTIEKALLSAKRFDTIKVFAGNYSKVGGSFGNYTVNRSVTLQGIPDGSGNYPVLTNNRAPAYGNTSTGPDSTRGVIHVTDSSVTLRYLQIEFNQTNIIGGITAISSGVANSFPPNGTLAARKRIWNNLQILDCKIYGTGTAATTVTGSNSFYPGDYNSCGIYLIGYSWGGTLGLNVNLVEDAIIKRCTISSKDPNNAFYIGRGIRIQAGAAIIGGAPGDGNTIDAFYGVQLGGLNQLYDVSYNTLGSTNEVYGGGPGLNKFNNNTLIVKNPKAIRIALEIKDFVTSPGATLEVKNNTITGYGHYGINVGRTGGITLDNNVLTPADTSTDTYGIYFDTKFLTGSTSLTLASVPSTLTNISITNNTVHGGAVGNKGAALLFGNGGGTVGQSPFSGIVLTGNTFHDNYKNFIAYKTITGSTLKDPLWYGYSQPQMGWTGPLIMTNTVTATFPIHKAIIEAKGIAVDLDLDASANYFGDGAGGTPKLPSAMSETELFSLEDRIQHGSDWDSLGFVTVIPNTAFVTGNNFALGKTLASAKHAGNSVLDGFTIKVAPGVNPGRLDVKFNVTLASSSPLVIDSLQFNGSSKSLTLAQNLTVNKRLQLSSGKLQTNGFTVTGASTSTVSGGSTGSYVVSSAAGTFTAQGVTGSRLLPIGSSTGYAPVTVNDVSGDDFTAWVEDKASKASFSPVIPAEVPAWVNKLWHVNEGIAGGSSAKLTFGWNASETPDDELLYFPTIARKNGAVWEKNNGTLGTFNAVNVDALSDFGDFSVFSYNQELNIDALVPTKASAGQTITLQGVGFLDGIVSLTIGGTTLAPANYTVLNDSVITATVPVTVSGSVCVEMPYGTTCKAGFVFLPTINITGFNLTTACGGSGANISFNTDASPAGGNVYGVQLSNENGVFADSTSNVVGSGTTSPVAIVFPVSPAYGTGYKLRVLQSTPFAYGQATTAFELKPAYTPTASVAQTSVNPLCSGGAFVFTATINGVPSGTTYQWKVDNANSGAATASTSFITTGLSNGSTVSLTIVPPASACVSGSANSNTVTISGATSTPCGTVWTGAVSGDWNTAGNWTGGVPTNTTNTLVTSAGFATVLSASAQTATLTIDPNAPISGAGSLNFYGAGLVNSGSSDFSNATLIFNATAKIDGLSFVAKTLEVTTGTLTLVSLVGVTDHVDLHGSPAPPPRLGAPDANENNNGNGNSTMALGGGNIISAAGSLRLFSSASHTAYVVNSSASSVITG